MRRSAYFWLFAGALSASLSAAAPLNWGSRLQILDQGFSRRATPYCPHGLLPSKRMIGAPMAPADASLVPALVAVYSAALYGGMAFALGVGLTVVLTGLHFPRSLQLFISQSCSCSFSFPISSTPLSNRSSS